MHIGKFVSLTLMLVFQQTIPHEATKSFDMLMNKSLKSAFLMIKEFNSTSECLNTCENTQRCCAAGVRIAGGSVTCRLSVIPSKFLVAPFQSASFLTDDAAENVFYLSVLRDVVKSLPEPHLFYSLDSSRRGAPLATNFVARNSPTTYAVAFNTPANFSCKLMEINYLRVPNSLPDYNVAVGSYSVGNRITFAVWFMAKSLPYTQVPLIDMYSSARSSIHLATRAFDSMTNLRFFANPYESNSGTLPTALALNQWHHFAVAKNGTVATYYINGTRVATVIMTPLVYASSAAILQIGRRYLPGDPVNGYTLDGCLAHLALFNDTLNADQVRDLADLLWTQ